MKEILKLSDETIHHAFSLLSVAIDTLPDENIVVLALTSILISAKAVECSDNIPFYEEVESLFKKAGGFEEVEVEDLSHEGHVKTERSLLKILEWNAIQATPYNFI